MYKISYCFQVHSFAMVSGVRGEAGAPRKVSHAMLTTAAAMVTGVRGEAGAPRKVSEAMLTTAAAMVSGVRGEAGAPRKVSHAMLTTVAAMVSGVRGAAGAPRKVSEAMLTTAAAMVTVMMRLLLEKMDVGQVYCGMRKLIVLSLIQVGYWCRMWLRNRFGTSNFCPIFNPFPAIHENCRMLRHLLFNFESLNYTNTMDLDQTAPRSSLIRVLSVCIYGKSILECVWIYAADIVSRWFSGQILLEG